MGFYVAAAVQATQHSIIRVLDAEKQVGEIKTLPAIIDLIVRPSDNMLIVGFANGEVKMLALDGTLTPITSLVGLTMMALSDSGQYLALGNTNGMVEVWDLVRDWKTQTYRKRSWFMHRCPVSSLAFVVGPALVLSGGTDELLYLWDALNGKTIQCCEGHSSEIVAISTTGRGCMTAGGPGDNTVKLWDLDNGIELWSTPRLYTNITAIKAVPAFGQLFIGTSMGQILHWDTTNNQLLDEIQLADGRINDMNYSASAGQLVVSSQDGFVTYLSTAPKLQSVSVLFCSGAVVAMDRFQGQEPPKLA